MTDAADVAIQRFVLCDHFSSASTIFTARSLSAFDRRRPWALLAADSCGDSALIQRARDGLAAAQSAIQECLMRHGYANSGSQTHEPVNPY
jgi:hypothetical protein